MATTITSVANIVGNAIGQIIPTLIVKDEN